MKLWRVLSGACVIALLVSAVPARAQIDVNFDQIREAPMNEPGDWLTYNGSYDGHRHSRLDQVTPANVSRLKAAWVYQSRDAGKWECTPLVLDGVLYITEAPNVVTALDGHTGRQLWTYRRRLPDDVRGCCGPVNRGLAILGDALFLCTFDCHLVCLDANTGKERWDTVVADYKIGHSLTVAPLALRDRIIVGISGGEFGIRGFLDAYNPKTGERVWRRWTIPAPGEKHSDTWGANDLWKRGGGATWVTGTYDPNSNTLYWGVGNPAPDYNGDDRPGDNLYTNSVLAVNPDNGEIRWHFQYTPHDLHDWDANQVPVLIDVEMSGRRRKLLVQANRNAFFYVLDRTTGEFLLGGPMGKQTWASGLDAKGRALALPGKEPSADGVLVYPGLDGLVNWPSPSYSPETHLFYVQAQEDHGHVFYKLKGDYEDAPNYEGGSTRNLLGAEPYGAIKAIDPTTAKVRWEFREQSASNCAVLTTASGLLFSGTREGQFYALDAATGKPLWRFVTGAAIHGGPVTYLLDGRQQIAIVSGQGLFVFSL